MHGCGSGHCDKTVNLTFQVAFEDSFVQIQMLFLFCDASSGVTMPLHALTPP